METQELLSKLAHLEGQVKELNDRVENLEGFRAILERLLLSRWPEYESHREEGI